MESFVKTMFINGAEKIHVFDSTINDLSSFKPDGYFISNGPGDPEPLSSAINVAKEILKINKIQNRNFKKSIKSKTEILKIDKIPKPEI